MDTRSKVFWIYGIIFTCIFLWWFFRRNHLDVEDHEYLEVLSLTEWKAGRYIRQDMEKLKGGWLGIAEVYFALSRLQEEGLVERRTYTNDTGLVAEFRKKAGGRRTHENEESVDANPLPFTTQPT